MAIDVLSITLAAPPFTLAETPAAANPLGVRVVLPGQWPTTWATAEVAFAQVDETTVAPPRDAAVRPAGRPSRQGRWDRTLATAVLPRAQVASTRMAPPVIKASHLGSGRTVLPGQWDRTQAAAEVTFAQVDETTVDPPETTTRSDNPYGTKDR